MKNTDDVKLIGSGQIINIGRLPDELASVIIDVFREEKDAYTIIAAYAYVFAGLSIDEIRERFILTDTGKTRIASREFVRQKIKKVYLAIKSKYLEENDIYLVTTVERTNNFSNIYMGAGNTVFDEEEIDDRSEEEEEANEIKTKGKKKRTKTEPGPGNIIGKNTLH